jgi:hypothetical protein
MREYYQSLPQSWVVEIPEFGLIIFSKFTLTDLIHFQDQKATKMWPTSPDGLLAWLDLRQSALEATDIGVRAKTTTHHKISRNTWYRAAMVVSCRW